MSQIHPLASIEEGATLGKDVTVGPFAVIEKGAVIGDGCVINANAYISGWATLGNEVKVGNGSIIGTDPQDIKFAGEKTTVEIGDRTVIREYVTINRGTSDRMKTTVGSDTLLLSYSHVAHDCRVGNHVIMDNTVQLAGHVDVGDWAIIGGMSGVQQFVHIGAHAFIGGQCGVRKDVPPFIKAAGEPVAFMGVNHIGLKRRGFSDEQVKAIQGAYRILYKSGHLLKAALEALNALENKTEDVTYLIDFIEGRSKHGMIGAPRRTGRVSGSDEE